MISHIMYVCLFWDHKSTCMISCILCMLVDHAVRSPTSQLNKHSLTNYTAKHPCHGSLPCPVWPSVLGRHEHKALVSHVCQ